jgi:DNA-binding PucR family transcriptional regulator
VTATREPVRGRRITRRAPSLSLPRTAAISSAGASAVLELRPWLSAIARISAAVNNMEPLSNTLNAIAATTCQLLGYDFGAVLLVDDGKQRLLIRGAHGLSSSYIESINTEKPIRLGHGTFGEGPSSRAFRGRQPVVIRDYRDDPTVGAWAGVAIEQGFRSLAAVPLVVSGRAIGTLNCYTRAIHDFSNDELLLLGTIANQAAIAIEAARLREQERATIVRLEEARRSLEQQAAILERSEGIHVNLTRAVLENAGLQAIAEALTRIMGGAVVIDDPAGYVFVRADYEEIPGRVPAAVNRSPAVAELVASRLQSAAPSQLSSGDDPDLPVNALLAPVLIGKEIVARLWVLETERGLGPLERRALEHGATVVALELLKLRIANEVEGRLGGELLDDLLDGRTSDEQALRLRASNLGHDLLVPHAAIVLALDPLDPLDPVDGLGATSRDRSDQRGPQLLGLVNSVTRRLHADALVAEREGRIVILLGEHARRGRRIATELAGVLRREVPRYRAGCTISVAIGPWATEVGSFPRSYSVARGALELARQAGHDRTVTLDELGVYGLLLSVERLDELASFAEQTLGPLREYDHRKGGDLLPTLRAYLAHSCRSAETADALVVHPNTVSYRIRRIESILGLDLTRPDAQLQLQLALIVDDVGRVAPGAAAARNRVHDPRVPGVAPARPSDGAPPTVV